MLHSILAISAGASAGAMSRRLLGRSLNTVFPPPCNIGIGGATLIPATEGFGHDRKVRSAHFFELTDQPLEVTMAVSEVDAERLFTRLKEEVINIFSVKSPIEYGMSGER